MNSPFPSILILSSFYLQTAGLSIYEKKGLMLVTDLSLPQAYFSKIVRAVVEFDLIANGDRILIGLSGGKDSLLLTYALAMIRERFKKDFTLLALTVDPMFSGSFDTKRLTSFCASLGIPHETHAVDIAAILESDKKDSPCFTCAFFRRGAIDRYAVGHGCNKVAYAHHNDDAVETLLMSLLCSGQLRTFTPKTYLDRTGLTVIRPLVYLREREIVDAVRGRGLEPVSSPCPLDGRTARQRIKELVASLEKENPLTYAHLASALRENNAGELWPAARTRGEMKETYRRFVRDSRMFPEDARKNGGQP